MSKKFVLAAALVAAFTTGCTGPVSGVSPGKTYRSQATYGAGYGQAAQPEQAGTTGVRNVISLSGDASGPSGTLEVSLELAKADRGLLALPEGTDRVLITIASPKLDAPLRQEIRRSQFVGGVAKMIVTKLPLGQTKVGCEVFDDAGALITQGTSGAVVTADTISPVKIDLVVKEATGGLAISVDTKKQYADKPEVYLPPDTLTGLTGALDGDAAPHHASKPTKSERMYDTGMKVYAGQIVDFRGLGKITTTKRLYAVVVSGATTRVIDVRITETTKLKMPVAGKLCLMALL
ncbi:MAG: hypothetical protein FJZ01_03995 [Candidatus Sericytochromatia bacterium]|nr:hypothetical protein [Candidatus Tanganyikabacteria bacterium]